MLSKGICLCLTLLSYTCAILALYLCWAKGFASVLHFCLIHALYLCWAKGFASVLYLRYIFFWNCAMVLSYGWTYYTFVTDWWTLIIYGYINIYTLTLGLNDPGNSVRVGFADEICENMPYFWRNFEFGGWNFEKNMLSSSDCVLNLGGGGGGGGGYVEFLCGEESWAALLEECGFFCGGLIRADFLYIHFCSYSPSCRRAFLGQGSGTKCPKTKARKVVAY